MNNTMPSADGKARKRWLLAPYLLAVLLGIGWCGWWVYGKSRLEQDLRLQTTLLQSRGYDVSLPGLKIAGFPFRYFVTAHDVRIKEPGGFEASAPSLEAEAAAYDLDLVVLTVPKGLTIRRPNGKSYVLTGEALRMSVGGFRKSPPRISIEGIRVAIAGDAPLSAIDRFEARIRPADGDTADVFLRVDQAKPTGGILADLAKGGLVTLGVEGVVTKASALHGAGWPGIVDRWSAAGGVFNIAKGGLDAGQPLLSLRKSEIGADQDGTAHGKLRLTFDNASGGMLALGAVGILPKDAAAVGSGLAAAQALTGKPLEATLDFHDGRTWLGILPLGQAPRLY